MNNKFVVVLLALSVVAGGCQSNQTENPPTVSVNNPPPVSAIEQKDDSDPTAEAVRQAALEGSLEHYPTPDEKYQSTSSTNGWRAYSQGMEEYYRMVLEGPNGFRREIRDGYAVSFSPDGAYFIYAGGGDATFADGLMVLPLADPTATAKQVTNRGVKFGTWDNHPADYIQNPDTNAVTWPTSSRMRWGGFELDLNTMKVTRQ